jgi:hypothetical protein
MDNADRKQVIFVQFQQPGLKPGAYQVHAEISIQDPSAPVFPKIDKYLRVKGDRFALSPGSVDSVFPPDGSPGDYAACLPHVVLTRPTLPWERAISSSAAGSVPWLAVLLVTEEELIGEGLTPGAPCVRGSKLDEGVAIPCDLLTISKDLWKRTAPSVTELPYLAHVRRVETLRKVDNVAVVLEYGLVIGNRLPPPGQSCWAFLISVEDMADQLPPATLSADKITITVLWSWRVLAVAQTRTFADVVSSVNCAPATLRLPHDPAKDSPAATPLSMGFIPAPHDLRVGGQTVSWYRAPFVPYGATRQIKHLPIAWADGVTFYDPVLGMMDVSCSAAWALGRLLALNDSVFATGLYKWKRSVSRETIERAEYEMAYGTIPPPGPLSIALRARMEQNLAVGLESAMALLGGLSGGLKARVPAAAVALENAAPQPLTSSQRTDVLNQMLTDSGQIARLHHLHVRMEAFTKRAEPSHSEAMLWRWLGDLMLLKNVPIHYLVPDARMLPAESIRFFQVDLSWLQALLDGSFSIGRVTASDATHDVAFMPVIESASAGAAAVARPQARRLLASENAQPLKKPMSGFLLRSMAVDHWPGIEVKATSRGVPALTLRQEIIGPMLLCLFDCEVDRVVIHQPSEGVHFGFHQSGESFSKKRRRTAADSGGPAGSEIDIDPLTTVPYRASGGGVLDIGKLVLWAGSSTSDQFALQMVTGVDQVIFTIS